MKLKIMVVDSEGNPVDAEALLHEAKRLKAEVEALAIERAQLREKLEAVGKAQDSAWATFVSIRSALQSLGLADQVGDDPKRRIRKSGENEETED